MDLIFAWIMAKIVDIEESKPRKQYMYNDKKNIVIFTEFNFQSDKMVIIQKVLRVTKFPGLNINIFFLN